MSRHVPRIISNFSNRAFTLVEVVVALVILMVGLLALLQTVNLSIVTNLQSEMRTQGTMIGEDRMARIKSLPFDNISASVEKTVTVPVAMRSTLVNFSVTKLVTDIPLNTKKIDVRVRWSHRGNIYEHVVSSVVAAPTAR